MPEQLKPESDADVPHPVSAAGTVTPGGPFVIATAEPPEDQHDTPAATSLTAPPQEITIMRIVVLAFDTRGGIQPYVALSGGLSDSGHHVTMVTPPGFADVVTGYGVRHEATTGEIGAGTRLAAGVVEMSSRNRNRFMREQMRNSLGPTTDDVLAVAKSADLLIGGVGGSITGRPIAELLQIPWVDAHLHPIEPPTRRLPRHPGVAPTSLVRRPRAASQSPTDQPRPANHVQRPAATGTGVPQPPS